MAIQSKQQPGPVTASTDVLDMPLDFLGQAHFLHIYTQLCLCYSVANPALHPAILSTLRKGLERLSWGFPWIAGQVVKEGANGESTGVYKLKSFEKVVSLNVKDLSNDRSFPSMDALRKANFPMKMLGESILAPRRTIPGFPDEAGLKNTPALLVQATFLAGGLLLTVASHHAAMDMTGQGHLMSLLSKACHGESFAAQELMIGNLSRHNLIPFLDDTYQPGPEASILHFKAQPDPKPTSTPSSPIEAEVDVNKEKLNQAPPPCSWAHFTFRPSSLQALKFIATATKPSSARFISTDDALCALIWQAISRARLARLPPMTESTLGRAVDLRPHIDTIPNTYLGLTQNMVMSNLTLDSITTSTLGAISANLRSTLARGTSNILYDTSALATVITRAANKTEAFAHEFLDYTKDIAISSWKEVNCSKLDFNLGLGFPEALRRPSFTPLEGVIFFLPKALDGEVGVAICLNDEDMARLKGDGKFMKYATFVG
ncbi:uncharacterized protein DSM5745_07668 [Aspergillus mulundensis]|uniref:Trichothecene 3-O-acetyltransferase-like N-terminal domain-containing protein n=1 Tax=Aspergillus mulundensis TaxID=1810919 RepID=A0A3D8REV9_9EURO|nr:hypothetical protein DSM5745_07668 [Aspergillus mulundensis]RDW72496.1 hypothetical protein DSM5745_07668 [Aspergillus mulundensis]